MINYVNEALFRQNSIKKSWSIVGDGISLSNADLYAEQISLTESLCSEDNLIFGSCEAAKLSFTTSDVADSFINKTLTVSVILNNDTSHPFTLGTYIVVDEELTADRSKKR